MKKNLFLIVMMMWSGSVLLSQETWVKTFGGSDSDVGSSIISSPDGGYVITGSTKSNNGDFKGMNKGSYDVFVMRSDHNGNVLWKKVIGGSKVDEGYCITTTPDGGYVLTGVTESNDGDFKGMNKGGKDIFVIKLDSRGSVEWKKTFGGSSSEYGHSITTTPDGGFVLTGLTNSNDGDFNGMNKGGFDIFVIKLDSRGSVEWKKTFGGSSSETGHSITTTPDGGYVLTGQTGSNDGDFKGDHTVEWDIFVMKLDSNGNLQPSGKTSKKK